MRRLLARILRIPDARREEDLLERAMRATPMPVPPAGLRDRLLADAQVAARQASPHPRRSRAWMAWAAPAAVLVLVLAWLAFGSHGGKHVAPSRTSTPQMATGKPVPPEPGPNKAPSVDRTPDRPQEPHLTVVRHAPKSRPKPRQAPETDPIPRHPEINSNEEPAPEQPVIVVKVGPRSEGEISYARAAARDEKGVRTEWAIYVGDEPNESRQEMCVSDSDGRGFCLTTTSSNDLTDRLEETL